MDNTNSVQIKLNNINEVQDIHERVRRYRALSDDFPGNPAVWHNLAVDLLKLGRTAAARDAVEHALQCDPAMRSSMHAALLELLRPPGPADQATVHATLPGWGKLGAQPPQIIANWRLIRALGRGAFGAVYEAEDVRAPERRAAVKILPGNETTSQTQRESLISEVRAASLAVHENIVQIADFGTVESGDSYIAMELLTGKTLRAMMDESPNGRIAPPVLSEIAKQICYALRAAHSRGVIHCDLKPDNIFLVHTDACEHFVKVLDFGIAKLRVTQQRQTTVPDGVSIAGTAPYMAPEQWINGTDIDARADIYALGIILYEGLTGKLPFQAQNLTEWRQEHLTGPVPSLAAESSIPRELSELIPRMLAKRKEDRPTSIDAILSSLELAVSTIPMKPEKKLVRLHEQTERRDRPAWMWWAPIVTAIAVATGGVALWLRRESPPKASTAETPNGSASVTHGATAEKARAELSVAPEPGPAGSCQDLRARNPSAPSGVYEIKLQGAPKDPFRVYCEMNEQGGGWTLCLSARYTPEAKELFGKKYVRTYLSNGKEDPFGYYDFCRADDAPDHEYLYALGRNYGGQIQFRGLVIHLRKASGGTANSSIPGKNGGDFYSEQITAALTDVDFVRNDLGKYYSNLAGDQLSISLWRYDHHNEGLETFGRGLIMVRVLPDRPPQQGDPVDRQHELIVGSGCNYRACEGDAIARGDQTLTESNWSWAVTATAGIFVDSKGWQDSQAKTSADRVLLFYRRRAAQQ